MNNPLRPVLDRIARGFTLPQKVGLTILGVLWVCSPLDLDFIPIVGWIDDGVVLALIPKIWMAPTLPRPGSTPSAHLVNVRNALRRGANDFVQGFNEGRAQG
ncbi:MAG: DUF1232 domain-containing protein [Phycisphaeraceae bacterium]|nr:DUF1232 domain-containing protein [Phycisphaeraceae bacterium]